MTDTFQVGLVTPSEAIEWEFDTFKLLWPFDDSTLAVFDNISEPATEVDFPVTVAKTNNDPSWNEPSATGDQRFSHHVMIGPNALVEPHSLMINTRYDDTGFPYIFVWDWINGVTYGPLVLPDPVKQIEGPIRIGVQSLYFVAVDSVSFKPQLYRTNANLEDPTNPGNVGAEKIGLEGPAIPSDRSIENLMADLEFVSVLESTASGGGPFIRGHVWDTGSAGAPTVATTIDAGGAVYDGRRLIGPGRHLGTSGSFFPRSPPAQIVTIAPTEIDCPWFFMQGTGWGNFFFPNPRVNFTILNDLATVRYSYVGSPPDFLTGLRTWKTGAVLEADAVFQSSASVPSGHEVKLFPFE